MPDSYSPLDPEEAGLLGARAAAVRNRIDAACRRVDRDPAEVRLLAVSKTVPAERLRAAFAAGITAFGENKVQEARGKAERLRDLPVSWSIVGHLQTNKAKDVARFAAEFQALSPRRSSAGSTARTAHSTCWYRSTLPERRASSALPPKTFPPSHDACRPIRGSASAA